MTTVTGRWQIVEMDRGDRDAIDLLGPAFVEIGADGLGTFRFIAVEGVIDGATSSATDICGGVQLDRCGRQR